MSDHRPSDNRLDANNTLAHDGRMEAASPVITINGPGHDGTRFVLQEGITSFGRLPSNDVVLVDDLVSRNHARITFFEGRATLQDLGSHNGSYVNGERIEGAQPLGPGDLCRIGPFQVLLRWTGRASVPVSGPRPEPPAAAPDAVRTSSRLLEQIEATRSHTDRQPQPLQVLLRATEALATAAETDDYIGRMLRLALDQTGAERGAYVEPRPTGMQVVQVNGPDGAATDAQIAPAVVDWALSKNYPLRVDDLADDLRFSGPSQALLCVPVAYGDEVLGAFHVARLRPAFPPEGLDTLIAVAHLTGLGIQASRARRTAVRSRLALDTLARSFHPRVAEALCEPARADVRSQHVTLLLLSARDWSTGAGLRQSRARLAPLLDGFCHRVAHQDGRWHIGPGPTLFAVFDDDAGPTRAITVVDAVRVLVPGPPTLRAAITRGTVLSGVADSDAFRHAVLAGPALDNAERLVVRVPPGQVWLDEAASRLYPGPLLTIDPQTFQPT